MNKIKVAIVILIFIAACTSAPVECYGFTGDEPIVSTNPCLQAPYPADNNEPIIQVVPDGWQIINELLNADGVRDEYTARARITSNDAGITYELHNGLFGIDGHWGYGQMIDLRRGCYLLKVSGRNWINDPPHSYNFSVSGWFDTGLISQQVLPAQDGFELIYPFEVVVAGEYPVRWSIDALWGTAGHGSKVDVLGAGVLSVGDGYCEDL